MEGLSGGLALGVVLYAAVAGRSGEAWPPACLLLNMAAFTVFNGYASGVEAAGDELEDGGSEPLQVLLLVMWLTTAPASRNHDVKKH